MSSPILCHIVRPGMGPRLGVKLPAHISYLTRPSAAVKKDGTRGDVYQASDGKKLAENDLRELKKDLREKQYYWQSLILSYRDDISRKKQHKIAHEFAQKILRERPGNRDVYFVHHGDTEHPHTHLVVVSEWREDVKFTVRDCGRDLNRQAREIYDDVSRDKWREHTAEAAASVSEAAAAAAAAVGESGAAGHHQGGRLDDDDSRWLYPVRRQRRQRRMEMER